MQNIRSMCLLNGRGPIALSDRNSYDQVSILTTLCGIIYGAVYWEEVSRNDFEPSQPAASVGCNIGARWWCDPRVDGRVVVTASEMRAETLDTLWPSTGASRRESATVLERDRGEYHDGLQH